MAVSEIASAVIPMKFVSVRFVTLYPFLKGSASPSSVPEESLNEIQLFPVSGSKLTSIPDDLTGGETALV